MENILVSSVTKTMEVITNIQVCLISWMNINYKEYGGKKAFLANPKHQYHLPIIENMILVLIIKKRDYYEYPSLSHFVDEH